MRSSGLRRPSQEFRSRTPEADRRPSPAARDPPGGAPRHCLAHGHCDPPNRTTNPATERVTCRSQAVFQEEGPIRLRSELPSKRLKILHSFVAGAGGWRHRIARAMHRWQALGESRRVLSKMNARSPRSAARRSKRPRLIAARSPDRDDQQSTTNRGYGVGSLVRTGVRVTPSGGFPLPSPKALQ